jgi:hypothetical protein
VQVNAKRIRVDTIGDFGEVKNVYYSKDATANILSFAAMVDEGAVIEYDHNANRFTLQPCDSNKIYSFCRRVRVRLPSSMEVLSLYELPQLLVLHT